MGLNWMLEDGPFTEQGGKLVPLTPHRGQRASEAPRLSFHPDLPGIVVKQGPDGPDFITFCVQHEWAGPALPRIGGSRCPFCACATEEADGKIRFANLQRHLAKAFDGGPHNNNG